MDKEDSIVENIIFDNEEDEEYFEIMRSRRIKKSFMINNYEYIKKIFYVSIKVK